MSSDLIIIAQLARLYLHLASNLTFVAFVNTLERYAYGQVGIEALSLSLSNLATANANDVWWHSYKNILSDSHSVMVNRVLLTANLYDDSKNLFLEGDTEEAHRRRIDAEVSKIWEAIYSGNVHKLEKIWPDGVK